MVTQPNPTPYFNPTNPPAPNAAGEVSRRALFATAGLGVCAAAVVGTPIAIKAAEQYAADQAAKALQDGIDQGKELALIALDDLEEVSLDTALAIANVMHVGIKFFLLPLAQVSAAGIGGALTVMYSVVDGVKNFAGHFGYQNDQLNAVDQLLKTWQDGVAQLPTTLSTVANADISDTEKYLTALKSQVDAAKQKAQQGSATPTATP